ncbi:MAG: LamG domain-containing protein, partial [Candidatus Aenigmarchaeota archaeon]|nr:LamG domain-containing protein [Candidatus Aenigmarchaeota archaeon]
DGAQDFDGNNDYVDCENDESLSGMEELTVECWVYATNRTGIRPIIGKQGSYIIDIQNERLLIIFYTSEGFKSFYPSWVNLMPTNTWVHIIISYENSTGQIKVYQNGIYLGGSSTSGSVSSGDVLQFGHRTGVPTSYFNGTIDQVRIYNRSLSAEEIAELFQTTKPKASFNGNANIIYDNTLDNSQSVTLEVSSGNFTVGENNITIYTDSGVVDYSVNMLSNITAIITNTGMNNVTVKQVAAFKDDGTYCVLKNDSTTFDVGGMFSVSGCGMECFEFLALKAYTDCTGVQGIFSGTPEGC